MRDRRKQQREEEGNSREKRKARNRVEDRGSGKVQGRV